MQRLYRSADYRLAVENFLSLLSSRIWNYLLRGSTTHNGHTQWPGPSYIHYKLRKCNIGLPIGKSGRDILSFEVSLSQIMLNLCQVEIKLASMNCKGEKSFLLIV